MLGHNRIGKYAPTPKKFSHSFGMRQNTRSIAWRSVGNGVPLVLIHGVGMQMDCWFQQADALADKAKIFMFDLPGHGKSENLPDIMPKLSDYIERFARWFDAVVDEPAIIVGHSMGALIGTNYAAQFPQNCIGLMVLNGVYRRNNQAKSAVIKRATQLSNLINKDHTNQGVLQDIDVSIEAIARWFSADERADSNHVAHKCRSWLQQADLDGYAKAYRVFAYSDGVADICLMALTMPVWFVTGDGDHNSTAQMATQMAEIAPKGQVMVISGARHMLLLTHPEVLNDLLLKMINTLDNMNDTNDSIEA